MTTLVTPMNWLTVVRRYLIASAALNLAWEIVQLPLYTLWQNGSVREIAFAIWHCTAGDVMIAALSLVSALALFGSAEWPARNGLKVSFAMLLIGLAYTIYSEWLNTVVRQSWSYAPMMPRLPWIGTGLSPVLQWIVVPLLALRLARGLPRIEMEPLWLPRQAILRRTNFMAWRLGNDLSEPRSVGTDISSDDPNRNKAVGLLWRQSCRMQTSARELGAPAEDDVRVDTVPSSHHGNRCAGYHAFARPAI